MSSLSTLPACFKDSTVLITGAGGFIGGHLAATLKEAGANIVSADRKSSLDHQAVDVTQPDQVEKIFKYAFASYNKPVEYVFHLAGQKSAALARENPADALKTGFHGTLNILEACRMSGAVKKVILISSLAVYGVDEDRSTELVKESDLVQNDSIYVASKITTETVGLSYGKDFSIPVSVARLSNVYGPDQSSAAVIPSLISQMKAGQKITMGNTESVRDFIHVQDVVEALISLAANDTAAGKVFNVSTARGTSIKAITEILSLYLKYGGKIEIDQKKLRPNEKLCLVADNSRIRRTTGWSPKIKLEDGLKSLCQ